MFIPVASGIKPRMVVMAVNSTGRKRVRPASTMTSISSGLASLSLSSMPNSSFLRAVNCLMKSIKTMALFTTIPASEMIPIIVIMMTNSMRKMTRPRNTPIREKTTVTRMMNGVEAELNWLTRMRKIKNTAMSRAPERKLNSFACSSCSPVKSTLIPRGNS